MRTSCPHTESKCYCCTHTVNAQNQSWLLCKHEVSNTWDQASDVQNADVITCTIQCKNDDPAGALFLEYEFTMTPQFFKCKNLEKTFVLYPDKYSNYTSKYNLMVKNSGSSYYIYPSKKSLKYQQFKNYTPNVLLTSHLTHFSLSSLSLIFIASINTGHSLLVNIHSGKCVKNSFNIQQTACTSFQHGS
jgi:hypothetical protein